MPLFDSHCHFDFDCFEAERAALWQACQAAGVIQLLIPGVSPELWQRQQQLLEQFDGLYAAAGLHPWWIKSWLDTLPDRKLSQQVLIQSLLPHLQHPRCVAVGECGLDAVIELPLEDQQPLFEAQLQCACEQKRPVIVHVRRAHNQTLQLLKRYRPARGGVIHGFSGSPELAQQYWRLGFYLGVGGTITYERASKTRAAVKAMPLEALLLETDAPDMPLSGRQGAANSPIYLPQVATCLAGLRDTPLEQIIAQTTANTRLLFQLSSG